jgi:hypothetical protein
MIPMTPHQCDVASKSYTTCLLAQSGYDVLSHHSGLNHPPYDLIALKNGHSIPFCVRGSVDGRWMLTVRYVRGTYIAAIDKWLSIQLTEIVYAFVTFANTQVGEAPRVYIARPAEIAKQLKSQCFGRGHGVLHEDTQVYSPGSRYKDKVPSGWLYSTHRINTLYPKVDSDSSSDHN